MKKALSLVLVVSLSVAVIGCTNSAKIPQVKAEVQDKEVLQQTAASDKVTVESVVESFGKKLQMVSLQAPKDILEKSMKENYGGLVSEALLEKWMGNPLEAPGRLTSSPWPDRIEIQSTQKLSESEYEVKGKIIEITSAEQISGGAAAKRPITLIVRKPGKSWLIDDVTLGDYEKN